MTLLGLILLIVVVGLVMWAINRFVPMEGNIKTLLNVAVVIFLVFILLRATGLLDAMNVRL